MAGVTLAAALMGGCGSDDDAAQSSSAPSTEATAGATTTVAAAGGQFDESMCPSVADVDGVVSDEEIQDLTIDLRADNLFCIYHGQGDRGATVAFWRRGSAEEVTENIETLPWDDEPARVAVDVSKADEAYQGEYSAFRQLMARIDDLEVLIRIDLLGSDTGHDLKDLVPLYELAAAKLP
jgi:hypothetical protein